jgi:predicted ATPase
MRAMREVQYKKIFIMDLLPLAKDYARTEDSDDQRRIEELLRIVYLELGIPVVRVPVMPAEERADFVLANL